MHYRPKYFKLYELVPKELYTKYKDWHIEDRLWNIFDERLLYSLDQVREHYGKMTMNTWWWKGGIHQYRGYRPGDCPIGAELSQHKFGRGGDLVPQEVTGQEIRDDIKKNPWSQGFEFITCIEDFPGMGWVHIDTRSWKKSIDGLLVVKG